MRKQTRAILTLLALLLVSSANSAFACAVCSGQTDSQLAEGMNWGIFTLLGVVVVVLGGIATFFVYLIKKSAATSALAVSDTLPQATQKI